MKHVTIVFKKVNQKRLLWPRRVMDPNTNGAALSHAE
jgi:hypothetical protein